MTNIDYKSVGLKCGVEIHQQLDTHKLFCNCPSEIRDDKANVFAKRKLRAVVGETGQKDVAAESESKKDVYFLYEGYHDTTCPIEFDEEPPRPINLDAVSIVLQISKMLNAKLVDEVQVMRKIVVNGSNTSGFQRTSFVSYDGFVETQNGKVRIDGIFLEEEAAKDVEKTPEYVLYNLSRLGIPLIEIASAPDITTPLQCKEYCELIGMILRSTGRVKRGIGTIRQDLNISIAGGARIEIKGAQDLKTIPLWIENEILRQQNILLIKEKVPKKEIEEKIFDVTSIFSNSQSNVIKKAFEKNGKVYAVKLPGFLGLTGFEIQPGRRVGTEISDYAKVYGGVGGLFHTDELPKYGITQDDVNKIKEKLECDNNSKDAFILVADEENKCKRALKAVVLRANLFKNGVLEEVRKPNDDGTSSFMRPIPGRNRMYPETDCIPVRISYDNVKLPELISQKIERYVKDYNLGKDLATSIVKEIPKFEEIVSDYKNLKPAYVAETLIGVNKLINKKYDINIEISEDSILEVLSYLEKGQITTDAVIEILKENKPISQIISNYELMDNETLEKKIVAILHENKDKPKNALTGIVMGQLRTKASPQKIIELVKKHNV